VRAAAAIAALLLLTRCWRPVSETVPVEPLRCTTGWRVEAETALRGADRLSFPFVVPLDRGVYAGFDAGWQRLGWNGAVRGAPLQLNGDVWGSGDRLLVTRRSDAGIAVQAIDTDGGVTRYATIPVTDAVGARPFETTAGVLVFSELPDAGVRLDRTTASTSVAVPYPTARWPMAVAAAGSGLLLLTGYPGDLAITPLTVKGETHGPAVAHKPPTIEAALQPCGSGTAALVMGERTEDGGMQLEIVWLDVDGQRVKGPVTLPERGFFPNLLCAGDTALAAWTREGMNAELVFARVTSAGDVTPEPIALSAMQGSGNWYATLRRDDGWLGLTWLRYTEDAGYRSMLASLSCKPAQ